MADFKHKAECVPHSYHQLMSPNHRELSELLDKVEIIDRRKSIPSHHNGLPERLKKEVRESFYILDTDHDGYTSRREVENLLWKIDPDSTHEEMTELLDAADLDDDGYYDVDEYLFLMYLKWNDQESVDDIKEAFKVFDARYKSESSEVKDNSGALSREEFAYILKRLGEPLTDQEVDGILDHFDRDGSGEIDFDEFAYVMTGPHLDDDDSFNLPQQSSSKDFENLSPVKRMLQLPVSRTQSTKRPSPLARSIKPDELKKPLQEVMDKRKAQSALDGRVTADNITRVNENYGTIPKAGSTRRIREEDRASLDSDNFSMCSDIIAQMTPARGSVTDNANLQQEHHF